MATLTPETQTSDIGGGDIPPNETTDEWGGFPDRELYVYHLAKGAGYGVLRLARLDYTNFLVSQDTAEPVRGPEDDELQPLLEEIETDRVAKLPSTDQSRLFS
jgi:hypothetical protein